MGVKKQYLKSKPICKVTFKVDNKTVTGAEKVQIVGEFNNWDTNSTPMKHLKSGEFSETIELNAGQEYQFKYLVNDSEWTIEPEADKVVSNSFNTTNSVLVL